MGQTLVDLIGVAFPLAAAAAELVRPFQKRIRQDSSEPLSACFDLPRVQPVGKKYVREVAVFGNLPKLFNCCNPLPTSRAAFKLWQPPLQSSCLDRLLVMKVNTAPDSNTKRLAR
eukprot:1475459-Amphidinium_carterae.1